VLRLAQRCKLSCVSGVLSDLVFETGVHTDNYAVCRLEMLEGEFEGGLDFAGLAAHPAGGKDLETQAGLVDLPDYFGHSHRARLEPVMVRESCERNSLRLIPGDSCLCEFMLASKILEAGTLLLNSDLCCYHFPDYFSGLLSCPLYLL